jgi:hypothetical protein
VDNGRARIALAGGTLRRGSAVAAAPRSPIMARSNPARVSSDRDIARPDSADVTGRAAVS